MESTFFLRMRLERIERKIDAIVSLLCARPAPKHGDKEENETQAEASSNNPFPDLAISRKFTPRFLREQIDEYGASLVRIALARLQHEIANKKIVGLTRSSAWKLLLSMLNSMRDEQEIAHSDAIKERALIRMLKEGEVFLIGGKKIRWDGFRFWIDEKNAEWLRNPDVYLAKLARDSGWKIEPVSASALKVMSRYRMFAQP